MLSYQALQPEPLGLHVGTPLVLAFQFPLRVQKWLLLKHAVARNEVLHVALSQTRVLRSSVLTRTDSDAANAHLLSPHRLEAVALDSWTCAVQSLIRVDLLPAEVDRGARVGQSAMKVYPLGARFYWSRCHEKGLGLRLLMDI